jgi:hypothetical protein
MFFKLNKYNHENNAVDRVVKVSASKTPGLSPRGFDSRTAYKKKCMVDRVVKVEALTPSGHTPRRFDSCTMYLDYLHAVCQSVSDD